MDFTEIQFMTIDEFLGIMLKTPLNFVLFNDGPEAPFADSITLEGDEAAYYVDVRKLNEECFQRIMISSVIDRRADPWMQEVKPIPHLRSFVGGEGPVDTYYVNGTRDMAAFLKDSRKSKTESSRWRARQARQSGG